MASAVAAMAAYGLGAPVYGAISSSGDISPVPPAAGGAVAGPLHIGNVDVATMTINTSGGPSPLSNTNSVLIGETNTGIGIVNMSGLGSDWTLTTAGADMTVGMNGTGSLNLSNLAFLSIFDDLFVGNQRTAFGEISISGFGTIVDVGDDANIGQLGQAVVEIFNGGRLVSDANIIGDEAAGDGRVTLSDPFSLWRTTNTLLVGDAGRGRLQIFAGARVENTGAAVAQQAGSTGTVEVSGLGSRWDNSLNLIIGEFGRGTLLVSAGGRVSNGQGANSFIIGRQLGSVGEVQVRGLDSQINVSLLDVGDSGDGTLRILEGGRVTSGISILGDNANSRGVVVVDGQGSRWDASGAIDVGDFGEAHLTISNGGVVHTSSIARVATLGKLTLDDGRLEVETTPISLTNSGVIEGNGTIEAPTANNNTSARIRPRGTEPLLFTGTLTNSGLIDVQSGILEVADATTNNLDIDARDGAILRFRGLGLDNNSGAQLAITSGLVDVFGPVTNDAGAEIVVGGTATAVFHDALTNNGNLFVQTGGKVLMLENLGFAASATLGLPLSVGEAQAVGQLDVAGTATLAGTVQVAVTGPQQPRPGDQFTFLTSDGRTGTFSAVTSTGAPGLEFHTIYTATEATLFVIGAGDKTWGVDAGGNASVASNWLGGVAPGGVNDKAVFSTIITANRVVAVDAPMTVGSITFDDNNSYSLAGPASITLDVSSGNARINVLNVHGMGSHSIAAPLTLNDDTVIDVAGGSSLGISSQMTAAPGVGITKSGGGQLSVKNVRVRALTVDGGVVQVLPNGGIDGVSVVDELVIKPGATMDLNDNDLIINGGNLAQIESDLSSGRLRSSAATSIKTVGAILNGSRYATFSGQAVSADDVLVKYTYFGDTNLDGRVNIVDYLAADRGAARGQGGWQNGDFDFSGVVDGADFFLMDQAFLGQSGILSASAPGAASNPVPEPVSLLFLVVGAALLRRARS